MRRSVTLLTAGLALLATACQGEFGPSIGRVTTVDGQLYVVEAPGSIRGDDCNELTRADTYIWCRVWTSNAGGSPSETKDWTRVDTPTRELLDALGARWVDEACSPTLGCFSITRTAVVNAEGETAWSLSPGRRAFIGTQRGSLHLGDIAGNETTIVVAAGNQGLLVGTSNGSWDLIGLGAVRPTPTSSFMAGLVIEPILLAGAALLTAWMGIAAWVEGRVPGYATARSRRLGRTAGRRSATSVGTAIALLAGPVVTLFAAVYALFSVANVTGPGITVGPLPGLAATLVVCIPFAGSVTSLRSRGRHLPPRFQPIVAAAVRRFWMVAASVWVAGMVPFALWTLGVVDSYVAAVWLALPAATVSLIVFLRGAFTHLDRATPAID